MERETEAAEKGNQDQHRAARKRSVADLRRTLVGAGYLLSSTASGAILLEDVAGQPIATVRVVAGR